MMPIDFFWMVWQEGNVLYVLSYLELEWVW